MKVLSRMPLSKRIFDIVVSLITLIVLSPVLLIILILILFDDGLPVFFRQERVGKDGRLFKMNKFRTMVKNASKIGSHQTSRNDARITKLGRILRKASLDELPQLINVLKGDMSIVGPRPNVVAQKDLFSEENWNLRNKLPPGITGLAQVSGRSDCSLEERLNLDIKYIETQNFLLDLKIIFKTFYIVIFGKSSF